MNSSRRPTSNKLARVHPLKHPHYDWSVRVGFFLDATKHYFKTRDAAEAFAAKHNTPASLLKAFRPYFGTEAELRAFLRLPQRAKSAPSVEPSPAPEPEPALTPRTLAKEGRYMIKNQFRVMPLNNKARPHLKFVVRFKEAGKYVARFFTTKGEAQAFSDARNVEVMNHGVEALDMPSEVRGMAIRCNNELAAFGKTIADATAHFVAYLKQSAQSRLLPVAQAEWLAYMTRRGYGKKHLQQLRGATDEFMEFLGNSNVPVCQVTRKEVNDFLGTRVGLGPVTLNHRLRRLSTWFNFCRRNGYLVNNPAADVEKFRAPDKPPGVVSPDEVSRLLIAASNTPLLPFFAIGAFAGLRVAEICRLDWREVDLESGFIEVAAAKSKTATRRIVRIQPNLAEWLKDYAATCGPVVPAMNETALRKAIVAVRGEADALLSADEIARGARKLGEHWPHNALRHSFASYHIAHFKDASALALEMGHTTTQMIFQHYRQVVKPREGEQFWNVRPVVPTNVVEISTSITREPAQIQAPRAVLACS